MDSINKIFDRNLKLHQQNAVLLLVLIAVLPGYFSILSRSIHTYFSMFSRSSFDLPSIILGKAWQVPVGYLAASRLISGFLEVCCLFIKGVLILLLHFMWSALPPRSPPYLPVYPSR